MSLHIQQRWRAARSSAPCHTVYVHVLVTTLSAWQLYQKERK